MAKASRTARSAPWRPLDTSEWGAKFSAHFAKALARNTARPAKRQQRLVANLTALLIHAMHLSTALARLSTLAKGRASSQRMIEVLGDVAVYSERVAYYAQSVVIPTRRLLVGQAGSAALIEAELRALSMFIEALSFSGVRAKSRLTAPKRPSKAAASLLTTRSTRRTPASRGLRSKPLAAGRAR